MLNLRVALVTARKVDPFATDDAHLTRALAAAGIEADWLAWDAHAADWPRYDLVVLRSTWDYPQRLAEFTAWLDAQHAAGVKLANSHAVVRDNLHKRYLARLAATGLPVPALKLLPQGARVTLAALAAELGSDDLVIKPAVSGTAWKTFRTRTHDDPEVALDALLAERDTVVQRYLPEIAQGEWSLVYLGGEYSHAVLKQPRRGDFRCQGEFGGTVEARIPKAGLVQVAERVLARHPPTLYARVDLVVTAEGPQVMEVELVEPQLFFGAVPGSAARAASILSDAARELRARPLQSLP
jgi:glutathione synthase/RimK-type ligase-like ATP-grasp enzyme